MVQIANILWYLFVSNLLVVCWGNKIYIFCIEKICSEKICLHKCIKIIISISKTELIHMKEVKNAPPPIFSFKNTLFIFSISFCFHVSATTSCFNHPVQLFRYWEFRDWYVLKMKNYPVSKLCCHVPKMHNRPLNHLGYTKNTKDPTIVEFKYSGSYQISSHIQI